MLKAHPHTQFKKRSLVVTANLSLSFGRPTYSMKTKRNLQIDGKYMEFNKFSHNLYIIYL